MAEFKIYRIRDRKTGQWSSGGGGPRFGKRGKTWDNLAHVSSHITCVGSDARKVYKDAEIVEYVLTESENRTLDIQEILDRKDRQKLLEKKHGRDLADLVGKLEKEGKLEEYRWCVVMPYMGQDEHETLKAAMKKLGLKRNNHRCENSRVYAFSDKQVAMGVRLAAPLNAIKLDLVDLVEDY